MSCTRCRGSHNRRKLYQNPRTGYTYCPYCGFKLPEKALPSIPMLVARFGGDCYRNIKYDKSPLTDANVHSEIARHKGWIFRIACGGWVPITAEAFLYALEGGTFAVGAVDEYLARAKAKFPR